MNDTCDLMTPVLFLVFNRPETTQRVFEAIRQARPRKLFIGADGPRLNQQGETEKCNEVREITTKVDWDCEVKTLFREKNLGCGKAVSLAIEWFFEQVEEGIILEDDCLPDQTFFQYCQELLALYRNDTRVMHINGNNFASNAFINTDYSYHFCSYPQAWGWASWRRAWQLADMQLSCWPIIRNGKWLKSMGWSAREYKIQETKFDRMHQLNPDDIWDYQWHLSVFCQHGLAIVPMQNLISNIGFSPLATHTKRYHANVTALETSAIRFPLKHPPFVMPDHVIDRIYRKMMIRDSLLKRIARKILRYYRTAN